MFAYPSKGGSPEDPETPGRGGGVPQQVNENFGGPNFKLLEELFSA
jgi:hypothetical protein